MRLCLAIALSMMAHSVLAADVRPYISTRFIVKKSPRDFGGLSGLVVFDHGTRALSVNDKGMLFSIDLIRDEKGKIRQVGPRQALFLQKQPGDDVLDAEGLASGPHGLIYVSTERPNRVMLFASGETRAQSIVPGPDLRIENENRGLEGVALDMQGRLVTVSEVVPKSDDGFPIYRHEDDVWSVVARLPKDGPFLVVGLDFGDDGKLYVLERAVSLVGFRSRIRRIAMDTGDGATETVLETGLNQFDNLEGLDIWRDENGRLRATTVSDNNFLRVQKTEIVEFFLKD